MGSLLVVIRDGITGFKVLGWGLASRPRGLFGLVNALAVKLSLMQPQHDQKRYQY
jgi:hypothetical protein